MPNGPAVRPRQARAVATCDRLVTESARLFATRGFDEVTVDEICDAAGVAKGTFYFHFLAKEDLLVALFFRGGERTAAALDDMLATATPFPEVVEQLVARIAAGSRRLPRHLVGRAVREVLRRVEERPGQAPAATMRRDALDRVIAAAQRRGEVVTGHRPAEIRMALDWALLQGVLLWTTLDEEQPIALLLRRRVSLLMHGIDPS